MSERPILFSGPMVKALLAGTKTQTRRVMNPQPPRFVQHTPDRHPLKHAAPYIDAYCSEPRSEANPRGMSDIWCWWTRDDRQGEEVGRCRYGVPGDRLWVRETWAPRIAADGSDDKNTHYTRYRADHSTDRPSDEMDWHHYPDKWRPSIHMPRWASRLTLEVMDVRVQRLHEITRADVLAEGVAPSCEKKGCSCWLDNFRALWQGINGERAPWSSNPWVWAITFVVEPSSGSNAGRR